MTGARSNAQAVRQAIEQTFAAYADMPDRPGQRIHCLFAGLYRETTIRWLQGLDTADAPLFAHLVIRRFYELYETGVTDHIGGPVPQPWRKYHWLAGRLTMRSPISTHLALLSLGARAHVRHDLGPAIVRAADDYRRITGTAVRLEDERNTIIGPLAARAFLAAALDYVDFHRSRQQGWRHLILTIDSLTLRALRPLWIGVLQGWRRKAWADALGALGAHRQAPESPEQFNWGDRGDGAVGKD